VFVITGFSQLNPPNIIKKYKIIGKLFGKIKFQKKKREEKY
jgi:hypothetical protein